MERERGKGTFVEESEKRPNPKIAGKTAVKCANRMRKVGIAGKSTGISSKEPEKRPNPKNSGKNCR